MKSYVDAVVFAIFAERDYELSYSPNGRYSIYRTKQEAEDALKYVQPKSWPWRVAPIAIYNGGFVPVGESDQRRRREEKATP